MQVERSGYSSEDSLSGGRVSNAWVTCLGVGNNTVKIVLIPHDISVPHGSDIKDLSL